VVVVKIKIRPVRLKGREITVSARVADALVRLGRYEYSLPDLPPVVVPDPEPEVTPDPDPKPKRQYRRRDMKAESE
jgi:hypothetical protein